MVNTEESKSMNNHVKVMGKMAKFNISMDVTITYTLNYEVEAEDEEAARHCAINKAFNRDKLDQTHPNTIEYTSINSMVRE